MEPEQIKHLEFIQNVITRMNTNSFQIKGWSIAIASALMAFYASTKNHYIFLTAIFSTLIFWFLDAYYLSQERKFRGLYDDVTGVNSKPTEIATFAMKLDLYEGGRYSYWSAFSSATIKYMYAFMILSLASVFSYFTFCINRGV